MTPEKKTFRPVTSSDVCGIYELLHSNGLVSFPLTQEARDKVDSIVSNITTPHFGVNVYPTVEEKAIAHLYFLIKDHPFTDGNKRTAVLTLATICMLNSLPFDKEFPPDALAVFVEKVREEDHRQVIRFIAQEFFKKNFEEV